MTLGPEKFDVSCVAIEYIVWVHRNANNAMLRASQAVPITSVSESKNSKQLRKTDPDTDTDRKDWNR